MIVYLSGKYSGEIDDNIAAARTIAIELWERGYTVLCPHLNTANFEIDCEADYRDYLIGDMEMIAACDAVVMLPGWEDSKGARLERDFALECGMFDQNDDCYIFFPIPVYEYPDLPPLEKTHDRLRAEAFYDEQTSS